jgi:hypothetical protein
MLLAYYSRRCRVTIDDAIAAASGEDREQGKCACGNPGDLCLSDGDCCNGGCKLDPMLGGSCS